MLFGEADHRCVGQRHGHVGVAPNELSHFGYVSSQVEIDLEKSIFDKRKQSISSVARSTTAPQKVPDFCENWLAGNRARLGSGKNVDGPVVVVFTLIEVRDEWPRIDEKHAHFPKSFMKRGLVARSP